MKMPNVRTRIAPSPTGFAHVGTAYIALFNLAMARKNKGKFILRIEDTDKKREVEGGIKVIEEGLKWLGFTWDEFYRQSDRLDVYKKYAQRLLDEDKAYEEDGGIILRVPREYVSWQDLIRGEITFPKEEMKDFAIIKKDGFPTYNFAVVVDDIEMKISHVIRAEDHISNTPRQITVYQALGAALPEFGHMPLLRNADRSKISKRKNPVALSWYQQEGYLPEALVNFLCLLGWSHPEEKEIFSFDDFVKNLDLARVRKTGPIFDRDKLDWINGEYIREMKNEDLKAKIYDFFEGKYDKDLVEKLVPLVKTRIKTLKEFDSLCSFFLATSEVEVDRKLLGRNYKKHLAAAIAALEKNESLDKVPQKNGFKVGDFFMDLRIALTGQKITPPINESIEILGREESIKRLQKVLG